MALVASLNQGLRFLLETVALAVFAIWGFHTGEVASVQWLLGLGTPILCAALWGLLISPKSPRRLQKPWLLLFELFLFALAGWALYSLGQKHLTTLFIGLYLLSKALESIRRQKP